VAEQFNSFAAGVASGTDKTIINLFDPTATPTSRGRIYKLVVGSSVTPADMAAKFYLGRSTAVGTEGAGFTPNNLDPAGPAGAYDAGVGVFTVEPTYTANKQLLVFALNQRATFTWSALFDGDEMVMAATQNSGAGLKTSTSTSTQAHDACVWHRE
jgi:hypothetical protein